MSQNHSIWLFSQEDSVRERFPNKKVVTTIPLGGDGPSDQIPSAIVVDPDHHAVQFCAEMISGLAQSYEDSPILVFSCWQDAESVLPLLKSGATGYLLKNSTEIQLHQAIDGLIKGSPLSPEIAKILLTTTRRFLPLEVDSFNLKQKEIKLLQLMSEGQTKKEISKALDRSVHTIDNYVRRIYLKMDVNNLGAAIGKAFRTGIIS